ncbi:AarF/ABC1/UbiB kinase family protein [Mycobacterium sp. KBS0706]|uniref:ABC1 kinase family protein n=1 Tax=Mycobacterium sp. KBS0706 TaxID=2578109 RepID=UPI00110FBEFF|nr:AarF/UbiB family protein [Mycobacterium sp. KBS0706]TSD89174.1 AarF/ABC1/UbiB kinase family protein [Mycobacterium sp. KBS0706]
MADEENSFGGRLRRYARVSGAMGGLAARVAGERYLGLKVDREAHANELRAALGGLKGPLMKVAQMLATIPEAVPKEYAQELQQLQADAPSMGWPFVKRRMASELGPAWQGKFQSFEHEAAAAASLGQVHRAVGLDGRRLACKLQYPDMQSAVEADLKQLKLILGIFERYDKTVSTKQIHAEISERLREELDYSLEARHSQLYAEMLAQEPNVHVPEVVPELSTKRLLTTTWQDGKKILTFVEGSEEQRAQLALNMFRAWYVPLYFYGVIHGDPHLGNYSVREDDSINLMDFGCIRLFPPSFVGGVIELYRALETNDRDRAVAAYKTWGFKNMTNELADVLNVWAGFLYGPILENKVRLIGEAKNGVYGRETAEQVHKELRRVGGIEVPREFVFMDRAALGLGSVFIHLKARVNWHTLFNELIADFDQDILAKRQAAILKTHGLTPPVAGA